MIWLPVNVSENESDLGSRTSSGSSNVATEALVWMPTPGKLVIAVGRFAGKVKVAVFTLVLVMDSLRPATSLGAFFCTRIFRPEDDVNSAAASPARWELRMLVVTASIAASA